MPKKSNIELHVHPFLGRNNLVDVVEAMNQAGLDVLALEALNASLYPKVTEEAKRHYPSSKIDKCGIRLPNGKYLLNAREYNTRENLHVLTVGYSMDEAAPSFEIRRVIETGLEHNALVLLDHPFVDNVTTRTAGHISEELEKELEKLCREYSNQITLEWNGYCIPWMRFFLKYGLKAAGFDAEYHNVNQEAEKLSARLKEQGYNLPVIADTDLHARTKRYLYYMGTARIIAEAEGETAEDIISSIRKNIFDGNYENVKRYVNSLHLFEAFCLPIMLPWHFKKPRA